MYCWKWFYSWLPIYYTQTKLGNLWKVLPFHHSTRLWFFLPMVPLLHELCLLPVCLISHSKCFLHNNRKRTDERSFHHCICIMGKFLVLQSPIFGAFPMLKFCWTELATLWLWFLVGIESSPTFSTTTICPLLLLVLRRLLDIPTLLCNDLS